MHSSDQTSDRSKPDLLLVEDDQDHRMITEFYLDKLKDELGEVRHAASLGEAQASIEANPSEIVILDLTLPDSTMGETLAAITELAKDGRYIVATSSLSADDIMATAIERGARAFVAKREINAETLQAILADFHLSNGRGYHPDAQRDAPRTAPPAKLTKRATAHQASGAIADPDKFVQMRKLASKIAHEALGWSASISFRTRAIERDPSFENSPELLDHLASIRMSADALASFVTGARSIVVNEINAAAGSEGAETIDLESWLAKTAEHWLRTTRTKGIVTKALASSQVAVPEGQGRRILGQVISELLRNAKVHGMRRKGRSNDDPIEVTIREMPSKNGTVVLECVDSAGPWSVLEPSELGNPLAKGARTEPTAGLGLYTARRALESMGGGLEIVERGDCPGSFAVRLKLPRA